MLIEVRNIPSVMGVWELKELIGQHIAYTRFYAVPYPRKNDQFAMESGKNSRTNQHGHGNQRLANKRLYEKAYVEPQNFKDAENFVRAFNGRPMSFQVKMRTTNYITYKDNIWDLQLSSENFDDVGTSASVRAEQRSQILDQHLLRYNKLHQDFLQHINTQLDQLDDEQLGKYLMEHYKQKDFAQTKKGECTFWEAL